MSKLIAVILLCCSVSAWAGSTVFANSRDLADKRISGKTISAFPDVAKTPSPGGPMPIPYPNIAKSSDTSMGAEKVKVSPTPAQAKRPEFQMAPAQSPKAGIVSSKTQGKAEFGYWNMDVKFEGKSVSRAIDPNFSNHTNTPPYPVRH